MEHSQLRGGMVSALPPCCWTQNIHMDTDTQPLVLCCSYSVCYVQTILINQSFFLKNWNVRHLTKILRYVAIKEVVHSSLGWVENAANSCQSYTEATHCPLTGFTSSSCSVVLRQRAVLLKVVSTCWSSSILSDVFIQLLAAACKLAVTGSSCKWVGIPQWLLGMSLFP